MFNLAGIIVNMSFQPDKTDIKIIQLLQRNGRITNIQLSNEIGLSAAPTLERVRKLEMHGFLESYHAKVNNELVGLGIMAYLLIKTESGKHADMQAFTREVDSLDEVTECYFTGGEYNYIAKVYAKDRDGLARLLYDKVSKLPSIHSFKLLPTVSIIKDKQVLPIAL